MRQKEQTTEKITSPTKEDSKVTESPYRLRAYKILRKFLLGFILISVANAMFSYFFYTPKSYRIHRENRDLIIKYKILQDRIRSAQSKVDEIRHRDNYVYRSLFATDTLSIPGVYDQYPDSKYIDMEGDTYANLMIGTWRQMDALTRTMYQGSVSLDEIQILSQDKEQLSTAIPATWPIDRTRLRKGIGPFGMRMHPKYGRRIFHKGIDLAGVTGDPIFATGDATVQSVKNGQAHKGYGKQILLDHKFGYQTRYAHLSKIHVKRGDKIVRGQLIGEVGSTGGSTGPHLHYEVILKGRPVNPINYFNRNMTNQEYITLMEEMKESNGLHFELFE